MGQIIQIISTLFIKVENGRTKTNRVSYRTIKVPYIRADVTKEEIIASIEILRLAMAVNILSVDLVTERITTVWTPEMRVEKLEEEEELAGQEQKQAAQISLTSAQTTSVHTAPAIMGEPAATPENDFRKEVGMMETPTKTKEGATLYNPNVMVSHDGKNQIDMTAFLAANPQMRLAPQKTTAEVGYVAPLSYADVPGYAEQMSGF